MTPRFGGYLSEAERNKLAVEMYRRLYSEKFVLNTTNFDHFKVVEYILAQAIIANRKLILSKDGNKPSNYSSELIQMYKEKIGNRRIVNLASSAIYLKTEPQPRRRLESRSQTLNEQVVEQFAG